MADKHTIARPYAEALFELASESGALEGMSDALGTAGALLEDGKVARFLANPSLTDVRRLEFLTGLFDKASGGKSLFAGKNEHGTNFLKLLIDYDRVGVLPEIAEHFEALKAKLENTVDVVVTSAASLNKAQKDNIAAALEKRLGRKVNLTTETDESLIGGAIIRAGDIVIDGSLRSRLESLSNALVA